MKNRFIKCLKHIKSQEINLKYPLEIFLSLFGGFDEEESGDFDLIDRGDLSDTKSASLSSNTSKPQQNIKQNSHKRIQICKKVTLAKTTKKTTSC